MNAASFIPLRVHSSQFPDEVHAALMASLHQRAVNHKFHYATYKQAEQWRAVFKKYSPFMNDARCREIYEQSYAAAADHLKAPAVQVVGLGCGSGEKDVKLLQVLRERGKAAVYHPIDVSTSLVLAAWQRARNTGFDCAPGVVCDVAATDDIPLDEDFASLSDSARLVTFFGMLPNFEPHLILSKLTALLRAGELLLLSANLAPGSNYEAGVSDVLPQYDNALTNEWLLTFMHDLGIGQDDGQLQWTIAGDPRYPELRRIEAYFHFNRARIITIQGENVPFLVGKNIRLLFSYRYTPEVLKRLLLWYNLSVEDAWQTEDEAVFLCRKL